MLDWKKALKRPTLTGTVHIPDLQVSILACAYIKQRHCLKMSISSDKSSDMQFVTHTSTILWSPCSHVLHIEEPLQSVALQLLHSPNVFVSWTAEAVTPEAELRCSCLVICNCYDSAIFWLLISQNNNQKISIVMKLIH